MTIRMTLKRGDLAHWLASSLCEHVGLLRYRFSKDAERSFCPTCGSTIGFHRVHETSLLIGSLDTPGELPVTKLWTGHVWFKDHIPWFDTADEWPRYSEFPPGRVEELNELSGQDLKG